MSELQTQNITEADVVLGKIANGLQSAASDHILGIAKDIYDTKQQAYQEDINEYLLNKVDEHLGDNKVDKEETFLDAVLERDITAELSVGGILEGQTLTKGMTFTDFVERLLMLINVGSIKNPTGEGTVSIAAPTIIVEKEENGSWVEIKSGTTVKENTKVRVSITNIPESSFEKLWSGIKQGGTKPGDVLAYGWLKSVDSGEAVPGEGHCEISTYTDITGKDHLTISIANGDFDGLEIDSDGKINNAEFTIRASSSTPEIKVGEIKVQSNSAKYQLKSDNKYEIAAVTSKHSSKPEKISDIPSDRKIIINKDANIGSKKSNSNYSTFELKVEGWGLVPNELKTTGSLSINPPTITVTNNTDGTNVSPGDALDPNHEITVSVKLNGNSSVSDASAYLQKTSSTFQYGWEKFKNNKSEGKVLNPTKNCAIGTTWSKTDDTLVISGTPNGAFKDMKISSDNKTITFITQVGDIASDFKVKAKSGEHTLLSDAKYDIYALSSIQSSGKSTKMSNSYSIANGQALKTFGSEVYSSESSFGFSIKDNPFGIIPTIAIYGAVSIGKPTITVTRISNGDVFGDGDTPELDPREKINVNVTIPKSQITTNFSAVYNYSGNYLKYGWKLDKDGTVTQGKPGTNCKIDVTADDAIDTLNIKTANGVFKNKTFSGNTINWSNITASEASTLEVEAITNDRKIYPDANYTLYALSELGYTKDSSTTKIELSKNTSIGKINGAKSSSIFNFRLLEELWSNIPTLNIGNPVVSIAKPTIKVTKHGETTALNSPVELNPSDTLDIVITLNNSKISVPSEYKGYYQPNGDYLSYGWKLFKSGTQIAKGDKNTNCEIELTTKKDSTDTHTFNKKSGAFSGLSTSTLKLSNVSVGSTGGTLKITSTPSTYTVSPKYDYRIYALSNFDNFNDDHSAIPGSKQFSGSAQPVSFTYTIKAAQKELFYKIIQSSELGTTLQSANTYNPLTENNLINNLGFTKYTSGNSPISITGGWCLIMTPLNLSEISATDALGLDIAITNTNKNIGDYKVYYIQLDKTSTATLKIK